VITLNIIIFDNALKLITPIVCDDPQYHPSTTKPFNTKPRPPTSSFLSK
jgi:hypothetical protein